MADTDWNYGPEDLSEGAAWEEQLRSTLRRIDVPEGFSERLMDRVGALDHARASAALFNGKRQGMLLHFSRRAWRAACAAAAVLAITAGTVHMERVRAEKQRADTAAAQLNTAMAVTDRALGRVSAQLEATELREMERVSGAHRGGQ